jgi:hypothetical protein
MLQRLCRSFVVISAVLILVCAAGAQTATINGTVTDPSGALVQHAIVTATNTATNIDHTADTGTSGVYSIPQLPPGPYDVTIEKTGFRPVRFAFLTLTVDQALTLDAKLEVGGASTSVTVEGTSVAPINTTDAQVSSVVDAEQMEALPLILRDPYQLILLSPGTTQTNSGLGGFSINGGRERNNNFELDGTNNNDPGVPGGTGLVTLNPDATEEFRVISNNYDAEFGRDSSAVIDIVTRSGTNHIHGDVYYFGRWNALGARDFFNTAATGKQSPYVRNTFGVAIGGPVIKNKLFYFFNYEGNRFATATTTDATVPDPAYKTGIFTTVSTDPTTNAPVNVPIDVSTPTSANNAYTLGLDPQTQKILNYYPAPNGPAVIQGVSDQYFFGDTDLSNGNNYTVKVDYTITPKNSLSLRYIANQGNDNGGGSNYLPGIGGYTFKGLTQSMNGHLVTTITPTLQSDLRGSANRSFSSYTCNGASIIDGLSLAGLDAFGRGRDWNLPAFTPVACAVLGDSDGQDRPFGTYLIGDNITWIKGRHTIKFGYEFDDNYSNDFDNFGTRSTPNFGIFENTETTALQGTAFNSGAAVDNGVVEDAVWGLLGGVFQESQTQLFTFSGTRAPSDERGFRERDMYGFIQDQFKVKSNLTVSYGLRYEWNGTPWVVNDQLTSATPAALSGPPPIQFVQVTRGGSNPLYVNDVKGFEPRFGVAWDPFKDGKTSVRLGFGVSRDRQFFNLTGNTRANPPFSLPYVNSAFFDLGPGPSDQISNIPIPATQPAPPSNLPQFSFAFPATIDPSFHVPYVYQWNVGIQRQLPGHFTLEINYVANSAHRLSRVLDGNAPIPASVAVLRSYCADPTYNPVNPGPNPANPYGCIDNPIASPNWETVQGANLYYGADLTDFGYAANALPFDAVNNNAAYHSNLVSSVASSNSNALQTSLTRQFNRGMSLQVNYTWAHAIDDATDALAPQQNQFPFAANSFYLGRERANSSYDVRNRLVFNYVADLPVGRGTSHLSSGLIGKVLEGWSWSGIGTFQSGFPFEIWEAGVDSDGTGAQQRASYLVPSSPVPVTTPLTQTGPNVGLFTYPLFGGPGNVQRNTFYGPAYKNFDMVVGKTTKVGERLTVEFRSEYYNIFNHPNFQQPSNTINNSNFGQSTAEVGRNDGTTGARQLQFSMKFKF